MSGQRKRLNEYLDKIIDLPVEVIECRMTKSNHVKVVLQHDGKTRFFVASSSSSDVRSWRNFRGEIVKWIKQREEKGNDNA
jgi:hypothetical protein